MSDASNDLSDYLIFGSYGYIERTDVLFFSNIMLPPNAEVSSCQLNLGNVVNENGKDFLARVYVLVSQDKSFRSNILRLKSVVYYKDVIAFLIGANYTTFLFNGSFDNVQNVSLSSLLNTVRGKYNGWIKDIAIIIMPDDENTNYNDIRIKKSGITLWVAYGNKGISKINSCLLLCACLFTY